MSALYASVPPETAGMDDDPSEPVAAPVSATGAAITAIRAIPDPEVQPTMPLWPDAGRALGLGRSATYEAAQRGDVPTLHFGRRVVVPTAALRRLLSLDERPTDG